MLLEPSDRTVNTPHPKSRSEAWMAFKAAQLDKYSKIRDKLSKKANKEAKAFYATVYDGTLRYFVIDTRVRRQEVLMEELGTGNKVWVKLIDAHGFSLVHHYRILEEHQLYRARQIKFTEGEVDEVSAWELRNKSLSDKVFRDDYYPWEMTLEEAQEYEQARRYELGRWKLNDLQRRKDQAIDAAKLRRQFMRGVEWEWTCLLRAKTIDLNLVSPPVQVLMAASQYSEVGRGGFKVLTKLLANSMPAYINDKDICLLLARIVYGHVGVWHANQAFRDDVITNLNYQFHRSRIK